ncbi:MAG: TRAP transporter substrate-binding protein DctP [Clostridiales Family XIII bacterium]|jgi:TRAP-type C4-dicarboxylate transport system substrate-binding protein|nr:TRAP transporter substrate-binding protein DctP [Clostridiales Family XIII bacterium]
MKRQKALTIFLAALIALALGLAGCGGGGDGGGGTEGTDSPGAEADAPAAQAGTPITIKVNSFLPEGSTLTEGTKASVENIAKFSNGELIGEGYYNGSLLGFDDSWEGTGTGTVDVSFIGPAILGQYSRLLDGLQLPYKGISPDERNTMKAFNEFVNGHEEFAKDLEKHNLKILYIEGVPGSAIHTTSKTVKVPADCKGIVIDALGKNNADFFTALGAKTMTLDFGEYLISAQRGVVDAFLDGWAAMNDSQCIEVVKKHTVFGEATDDHPSGNGLSSSPMTYVVNLDTWNKLSESQQQALVKAFEEGVATVPDLDRVSQQNAYNIAKERGDEIISVTGAEFDAWYDAAKPVIEAWIKEMDSQGYDGQKLYDDLQATLGKYQ